MSVGKFVRLPGFLFIIIIYLFLKYRVSFLRQKDFDDGFGKGALVTEIPTIGRY